MQRDGMLERDTEEHWHAISPQKEVELTLQLQGYSSPHVAIIAGVDLKGTVIPVALTLTLTLTPNPNP